MSMHVVDVTQPHPYNAKIVWHAYTRTWKRRNSYQRLEIHLKYRMTHSHILCASPCSRHSQLILINVENEIC